MIAAPRSSVLLVDDRPENLLALEGVLAPLGFDLVRAASGEEALRRLLREEFALIVLDVQMPGIDGFETARHIRERPRTAGIPIIFLTAISREPEHQHRGYDAGAVDYVAKPFDPEILRAKVSVLVEMTELRRTVERQAEQLARRLQERDRAQAALARQTHELERSNAELERFAGAAAGALRDPLLTAAGFLDLLRKPAGQSDAELLEPTARSLDRAVEVLDGLQRYAAVGARSVEHETIDLDDVVRDAFGPRQTRFDELSATLRRDPMPAVVGDRWQLVQLVGELLDNAIAFRSDVPLRVQLAVSRREADAVVTVRDNGRGIPSEHLPRLFTVLARGDSGVGLATCRRIVERHGGEIWAESAPERGTSISFSLPLAVPA